MGWLKKITRYLWPPRKNVFFSDSAIHYTSYKFHAITRQSKLRFYVYFYNVPPTIKPVSETTERYVQSNKILKLTRTKPHKPSKLSRLNKIKLFAIFPRFKSKRCVNVPNARARWKHGKRVRVLITRSSKLRTIKYDLELSVSIETGSD